MPRKDSPDSATVRPAVDALVSLQNSITRVEERWAARRELHAFQHQTIGDGRAQLRAKIPQGCGPYFSVAMNFKSSATQIGIRVVNRVGWNRISRPPNSVGAVIDYVLADASVVEKSDGPVVRPAFAHRTGLGATKTTGVLRTADKTIRNAVAIFVQDDVTVFRTVTIISQIRSSLCEQELLHSRPAAFRRRR